METTLSRTRVFRGPRMLLGMAIIILALALFPGSARAAAPERQAYASASSYSTSCVEERTRTLCTDTSVFVYTRTDGIDVCLSISRSAISPDGTYTSLGYEQGCAVAPADAFTIDAKRLSTATLAPTTVTLEAYDCTRRGCRFTSSRDVTVAATFTGTGDLMNFSNRSTYDDGACTYTFAGKGIGRNASANLTLDGQSLAGSGFLSSSTNLTKVQCR